jgi:hypothetical protein
MSLIILYPIQQVPAEYALDSDPRLFGWGGTNARAFAILIRTDVPSIFYKSGPGQNDWTLAQVLGVDVADEGVAIPGNPHMLLNFTGAGVTAVDVGGGQANIVVPGDAGLVVLDENVAIPGNPHFSMNFIGAGVQAVDAGAGQVNVFVPGGAVADGAALVWGVDSIVTAAGIRFIPPGHDNGFAVTTDIYQLPLPRAGTLRNLFVRHNSAGGNGTVVTYTILVNGVATLITAALATGAVGQASNLVAGFAAAQGARVTLQVNKPVSIGGGNVDLVATLELD